MHLEVKVEKTQFEVKSSTSTTSRRQSMVALERRDYEDLVCFVL